MFRQAATTDIVMTGSKFLTNWQNDYGHLTMHEGRYSK